MSDEMLAGTLRRRSSLQSTVRAWWYTDWGVYQGLVSHTHCRGHALPAARKHTPRSAGLPSWSRRFALPSLAPPTPAHSDSVAGARRQKRTAKSMVHRQGGGRAAVGKLRRSLGSQSPTASKIWKRTTENRKIKIKSSVGASVLPLYVNSLCTQSNHVVG